jgi:hypothetical protein
MRGQAVGRRYENHSVVSYDAREGLAAWTSDGDEMPPCCGASVARWRVTGVE